MTLVLYSPMIDDLVIYRHNEDGQGWHCFDEDGCWYITQHCLEYLLKDDLWVVVGTL